MRGRAILIDYQEQRLSLRRVARLMRIPQRTIASRWAAGKRGAELLAPPDEKRKRRGNWDVSDITL